MIGSFPIASSPISGAPGQATYAAGLTREVSGSEVTRTHGYSSQPPSPFRPDWSASSARTNAFFAPGREFPARPLMR